MATFIVRQIVQTVFVLLIVITFNLDSDGLRDTLDLRQAVCG